MFKKSSLEVHLQLLKSTQMKMVPHTEVATTVILIYIELKFDIEAESHFSHSL